MDEKITYMHSALEEANSCIARDEVPIGAVLVERDTGKIVAQAGNRTRELADPTAHAEMLVIRQHCEKLGVQRLPEYDLYVTLEPCPMCAAAISYARINTLYIGASDPKSGGVISGPCLYEHSQLHHKPQVVSDLISDECGQILTEFFKKKRKLR